MAPAPSTHRLISMKLLFSTVTVAIVAATMVGVLAITERNSRRLLQHELETRLLLEARHLALLSADALLDEFPELTLCPVTSEMLQDQPDLALAAVLDHAGRLRGHPEARQIGQPLPLLDDLAPHRGAVHLREGERLLSGMGMLAAQVPVRHRGGQLLGTVAVARDRGAIDRVLVAGRTQVLALAVGLALAGILLTLVVVRRLLAPLDALTAGLERIGRGDLQTPIALRSRTELGLLGHAIDTMAEDLDRSQAAARAHEQELIATQSEVIHTLGEVVESRSHETGNHIDRVALGAAMLAELAGLPPEDCELLRLAAPMHDVGKIAVPDAVLGKPGKLTDEEFAVMKTHTTVGHQILTQSRRPLMQVAATVARQHHERWDGKGYPDGLAGEDIHVFGRIVAVIDVFDALTSDRCYRPAMPLAEALAIMVDGRGTQFDPHLLDLFLENLDRFRDLMESRFNAAVLLDAAGTPAPEMEPAAAGEPHAAALPAPAGRSGR